MSPETPGEGTWLGDPARDAEEIQTYPPASMNPAEIEKFAADMLRASGPAVQNLVVTNHEVVVAPDGAYDMDATVRFEWGGLAFLVLVEAKHHGRAIERSLVQVLHQKVQSAGAQKGILFSTSPFQAGALAFAKAHGIALVQITEGRYTILAKSAKPPPPPTRKVAAERFGLPAFVAVAVSARDDLNAVDVSLIDAERPEKILRHLFGLGAPEESPI